MASTTKAGKVWQLLHSNEAFGAAMLVAVADDDIDGVRDALDLVGLEASNLNLTDEDKVWSAVIREYHHQIHQSVESAWEAE